MKSNFLFVISKNSQTEVSQTKEKAFEIDLIQVVVTSTDRRNVFQNFCHCFFSLSTARKCIFDYFLLFFYMQRETWKYLS